jgi:hypothetical protein
MYHGYIRRNGNPAEMLSGAKFVGKECNLFLKGLPYLFPHFLSMPLLGAFNPAHDIRSEPPLWIGKGSFAFPVPTSSPQHHSRGSDVHSYGQLIPPSGHFPDILRFIGVFESSHCNKFVLLQQMDFIAARQPELAGFNLPELFRLDHTAPAGAVASAGTVQFHALLPERLVQSLSFFYRNLHVPLPP